jgi:hypothetical protein
VKIVKVPYLNELSAKRLMADVIEDQLVSSYLPDISEGKSLNRQYLFNVISVYTEALI